MTQQAEERNLLTTAVRRAQRRVVVNRALWEAGLAATIALLGPTLFLLVGRDWFAWPLLLLFVLGGAGAAAWRLWRKRPDLYRVAQVLDARLATSDQISTAIYYLESEAPAVSEQRRAAARLAGRIDLEAAFPFTLPRSLYGLASVFLVASALCALRYFLEKPLRLDHPLPALIVQAMRGPELAQQQRREKGNEQGRPLPQEQNQAQALESNTPGSQQNGRQAQEISVPTDEGTPEKAAKGEKAGQDQNATGNNEGAQNGDPPGDPMAANAGDDPIQSYEDMLERDAKSGLAKAEGKPGQDPSKNQDGNSAGSRESSNSLLAKLKDAMGNMLSRLGQKSPGLGQQQQAANGNASDGSDQKEGDGDGQSGGGQPKPGGKQASGEGADTNSQDMAAQNSGSKAGGKTSDQSARGQAGSGAGRQEGDKQLGEARQQEAMGKLSELYGRRAANVSGEVTVEAQAGKQTLRTPQADKQARHSDAGGEVSRDEIPLAYQAYIKEYFSKLRQENNAPPNK
ncbi:MAG TPA: hypothetical protein VEU62_01080 [Bryobacterales bacterium]|nr:hypothetical protein [Bryobacterales bacterium]